MPPHAPAFWQTDAGLAPRLLAPIAALWGEIAGRRMARPPTVEPAVPVVAIGNFVAGGAGKTPTTLALAHLLAACRERPAIVLRGYGGRVGGPHRVAIGDAPDLVGDEALLAAAVAPTFVGRDRGAATAAAAAAGASVVLFDDGFQNPTVAKRLSVVVVDAGAGIGNGRVLPAGPLRAPFAVQLAHADAVVVVADPDGADRAGPVVAAATAGGKPVFGATLQPVEPFRFAGRRLVGYAGIGRPGKVAATLRRLGADVVEFVAFPDHHVFGPDDARRLLALAARHGAGLVTTTKDRARLAGATDPALAALAAASEPLEIALVFDRIVDVTLFLTRGLRR
jgi:tetraacyldisaccharide 4'-kinase